MKSARKKAKTRKSPGKSFSKRGTIHILSLIVIVIVISSYLVFTRVMPDLGPEEPSFAAPPSSTLSNPVTLEAENMSTYSYSGGLQVYDDAAASGGKGMMFSINTTANGAVVIPSTTSELSITAKADRCHGGPTMVISVADKEVMQKKVTAGSWSDYSTRLNLPPGSYNVSVSLMNDLSISSGQGCDRALFVDKLIFQ
jgi:hypothetical protein